MQSAPIPKDEKERLKKLFEMSILDTEPEERFDVITRDVIRVFNVPISTITIIDEKREWYKSCQGLEVKEAPRAVSFCAHAMLSRDVFMRVRPCEVRMALTSACFASKIPNPAVFQTRRSGCFWISPRGPKPNSK